MAKFVLTAQIQLQAPNNASQVVQQINQQLQGVNIPVSIKAAGSATKQINQLTAATQRASSAADAMGRSFGLAIKRFAAFTIASRAVSLFTNSLAGAIDESIAFQREVIKVSQVTGKSIGELRDLTDTITRLSVGLGTSSKDLLSTATILAQAGIGADDLKVALEALAKTTLAPNFDSITETAEGAVAILAQFGQGVGALEAQLGSVNAVAGAFAVEAEDLISAVRRFGGVFKASGGSLEELLALFTSVRATTRESAESIATGLRTIFTRIQRPQTIEFLRQYGVELLDLEGKFVGPFEASKRLAQALSGLEEGDIKFIRVAEELGGFRQIGKVIPLLQQFSVAQNALNVAQSGSGSLTKDAATAQQALAVQITKVKEEFLALVRSIAESTSFQLFARTALEVASALIKVADAIKPLVPLIAAMAAFKFAKGLGSFASGAGAAIRGLGTLGKNDGGRILGFARGGSVPGVGNQDTVPAMLTPGEFVIRKSSVNKIGADKLAAMNEHRYATGGIAQESSVGIAVPDIINPELEPKVGKAIVSIDDIIKTRTGFGGLRSLSIEDIYGSSGNMSTDDIKNIARKQLQFEQKTYSTLAEGIGYEQKINFDDIVNEESKVLIKSVVNKFGNFAGVKLKGDEVRFSPQYKLAQAQKGNLFEDVVDAFNGQPIAVEAKEENRPFDFTGGINSGNLFKALKNIKYIDAKVSAGSSNSNIAPAEFHKKIKNQLASDLYESTFKNIQIQPKATNTSKKASGGSTSGSRVAKFAEGGSAGTDTVPALLTPGEFVVNKSSAQRIGYGNLNRMNKQGVAKFAKGGSVGGGWNRFEVGGLATDEAAKDIVRARVGGKDKVKTAEDFGKAFKKVTNHLPEDIKKAILDGIEKGQGTEEYKSGIVDNIDGGSSYGQFRAGGNDKNERVFQVKTAKDKATTGTIDHEVGHLVDVAAGDKIGGGGSGYASEKEGTFQKQITDKITQALVTSMKKTGASLNFIENYAGQNREVFANLFAGSNTAAQSILASTGDAELAMIAMAEELKKSGEGFAGLSAEDLTSDVEAIHKAAIETRAELEKKRDGLKSGQAHVSGDITEKQGNINALDAQRNEQISTLTSVSDDIYVNKRKRKSDVQTSVNIKSEIKKRESALNGDSGELELLGGRDFVTKDLELLKGNLQSLAKDMASAHLQTKKLEEQETDLKDSLKKTADSLKREQDSLNSSIRIRDKLQSNLEKNAKLTQEANVKEKKAAEFLGTPTPKQPEPPAPEAAVPAPPVATTPPVTAAPPVDTTPAVPPVATTPPVTAAPPVATTPAVLPVATTPPVTAAPPVATTPAVLPVSPTKAELEAMRDAAKVTRQNLQKDRGNLQRQQVGISSSISKKEITVGSLKAKKAEQESAIDLKTKEFADLTSVKDLKTTVDVRGSSKPLNEAEIKAKIEERKLALRKKSGPNGFKDFGDSKESVEKDLNEYKKALRTHRKAQDEHAKKLNDLLKESTVMDKNLKDTNAALQREEESLKRGKEIRDKVTAELQTNAQAIKAAGVQENAAKLALGKKPSSVQRRNPAMTTVKPPVIIPPAATTNPKPGGLGYPTSLPAATPQVVPPVCPCPPVSPTSPNAGTGTGTSPTSPPTGKTRKKDDDYLLKLSVGVSAVIGGLGYLKPQIDENSSALAKFADGLVGGLQTLLAGLLGAAAAAQAFGLKLNAAGLKDIGQFFRGKSSRVGAGLQVGAKNSGLESGVKKAGEILEKFPGRLGKFGSQLTKLGPQLGKVLARSGPVLGPLIAGFAAGGIAAFALTKAVDSLTGVHEKAKKAIEQGNVAKAGETAVASANSNIVNKVTIALGILAGVLIAVSGPLGVLVGVTIGIVAIGLKLADAFGLLEGPLNAFRKTLAFFGLGPSTDTVKQEARLAAARKKQENEASKNANDVAMAMQRVESGSSTLTDEFTKGNLTGNLNNEFGVLAQSIALSNSRIEDVNNSFWALEGASTMAGLAIAGPLGALVGSMLQGQLDKSNDKKRAEALKEQIPDQEKATTAFMEQLPMFGNVLADQIMRGATADEAERTVTDNSAFKAATTSQFSPAEQARIDANVQQSQGPGARVFSDLEQQEIKIRGFEKQREEAGKQSLKAAKEQAIRQLALIKATNFGLGTLSDSLDATNKKLSKLLTIDQVGDKFGDSLDILQTALTSAAGTLSAKELDGAIATLEGTLREAGASEAAIGNASGAAKGFNTAFSRLNKDSDSFANIQKKLTEKGPAGATPQEISRILSEELTAGLDPEVATRINAGLDEASSKFNGEDLAEIQAGNFGPLREALQKTSDAFNKEVLGVLQKRSEAEQLLIKGIQQRIASEQEYVAAQRRAIELQLEAGKIFEEFGGKALTAGEKQQARVASFNVGAEAVGVRGLQTGNAGDIQSVSADISNQFLQLEERARAGAVSGERAFSGGAGAEEDTRERLKALQQDLISQTKQEIEARKEELQLIQRKNQAEKDSLESLISGDIEGFLEKQAAAGAGAALASGSSALTSLFSGSALGAGFKTLEGQGLSDDKKRRAEDLTLQRFGVQSTGVLSGTTTEEQAKKAEGRELATTLGQLGQQAAEFERAEVNTKQAIVYAQELTIGDIGKQLNQALGGAAAAPAQAPAAAPAPPGLYRGGPVYANRGMFVPRGTDTVPAMLTPGEFVVNRSSVQRGNNLQILQAMNKGGGASAPGAMSGGGKARYYNVGGAVDGVGSAFSAAIPQLTTIFNNFAATVDKLIGSKFQVALDTTNINVNFNGASFLETMKEDIKQELLTEVGKQISQFKTNTSGDLKKTNSVLG
jgi:TP901 family phage tail tape measure protein